eukprot:TRINITY_DN160_c0_g1_i3.p1 TRINITY_DN160_c0_g1~~TRINITY_DN160_c0_g1_i3.p1  ORF type:complete len:229 (+),score=21.55 TRINITY_DN160_c0_g1_i3:164-850(+)
MASELDGENEDTGWCTVEDAGPDNTDELHQPDEFVILSMDDSPEFPKRGGSSCERTCGLCATEFSWCNQPCKCKSCGDHVCETCSPHRVAMPHIVDQALARACTRCYEAMVLGTIQDTNCELVVRELGDEPPPAPAPPENPLAHLLTEKRAAGTRPRLPRSKVTGQSPSPVQKRSPSSPEAQKRRAYREAWGRRPAARVGWVGSKKRSNSKQKTVWSALGDELKGLFS